MKRFNIESDQDLSQAVRLFRDQADPTDLQNRVMEIIQTVRKDGDQALRTYTRNFDGYTLDAIKVSKETLNKAYLALDPLLKSALIDAIKNIKTFHALQKPKEVIDLEDDGKILSIRYSAIEKVALYVPGGLAVYPSSILMNVIPAQIAGCEQIIVLTPPSQDVLQEQVIFGTCFLLGIEDVFRVGGAQAIAAAAFGTETIPKVDCITGPGNQYVTEAKRQVIGQVKIDMLAGPSELVIVYDETANPRFIAADLLAQAEHDELAKVALIAVNASSEEVLKEILSQLDGLKDSPAKVSMKKLLVYHVATPALAAKLTNALAPEHLSLQTKEAETDVSLYLHAGSIFVGAYTPEAIGDYNAGSNHVLPTAGTARFDSGLNVQTFMKQTQIISYTKKALQQDAGGAMTMATFEKLPFHRKSLEVRIDDEITRK